jgi:hypothetical protein
MRARDQQRASGWHVRKQKQWQQPLFGQVQVVRKRPLNVPVSHRFVSESWKTDRPPAETHQGSMTVPNELVEGGGHPWRDRFHNVPVQVFFQTKAWLYPGGRIFKVDPEAGTYVPGYAAANRTRKGALQAAKALLDEGIYLGIRQDSAHRKMVIRALYDCRKHVKLFTP